MEEDSESDGWSMVFLHSILVVPPLVMALFTLGASALVWCRTKIRRGRPGKGAAEDGQLQRQA